LENLYSFIEVYQKLSYWFYMMFACITHTCTKWQTHTHTHTHSILFYPSPEWHSSPSSLKWLIWQGVFGCLAGCRNWEFLCQLLLLWTLILRLSYILGCFVWRLVKFVANRKIVLPQSLVFHKLWFFHALHSFLILIFVATILVCKINFYVSNINNLWFMIFGNVSKFFAKM